MTSIATKFFFEAVGRGDSRREGAEQGSVIRKSNRARAKENEQKSAPALANDSAWPALHFRPSAARRIEMGQELDPLQRGAAPSADLPTNPKSSKVMDGSIKAPAKS